MHRASRIEMGLSRLRSDYDAPALHLGDVIIQRLGDRIERSGSIDEPLNEFQATHLLLALAGTVPYVLFGNAARHCFLLVELQVHDISLQFALWCRSPDSDLIPERRSSDLAFCC